MLLLLSAFLSSIICNTLFHVAALKNWRNSFNLWRRKRPCLSSLRRTTYSTTTYIIIRYLSLYYGRKHQRNTISTNSMSMFQCRVKKI